MTDVLRPGGLMASSGRRETRASKQNVHPRSVQATDTLYKEGVYQENDRASSSQSLKSQMMSTMGKIKEESGGSRLVDKRYPNSESGLGVDDERKVDERYQHLDKMRSIFDDSSSIDSLFVDSNGGVYNYNKLDGLFLDFVSANQFMNTSSSTSDEDLDNELLDDINSFADSDWDIFANNSDQEDEWTVEAIDNLLEREESRSVMALRGRRETKDMQPLYPHRALMYHECQVCLTRTLLRRRVCCDFHICSDCMVIYISGKVNEANIQIQCPNYNCSVLIHRDEVNERLPLELKAKFAKFLINANAEPLKKTCPACSEVYTIDPKMLSMKKKKLKLGLKVQCRQCNLFWCFSCQAPFHTDVTCKQHQKGDKMVKKWAKGLSAGQSNAQRCPKCKIFIQKVNGCDHMKCSKCNTDFCYQCGDRYISIKLLGNHWSKFSLFGCKYRLMPKRPALRRLIRGTNFAARLLAGVALAGLGLAAGAILVGASLIIVPGYGIFRLRRHLQLKEKRKRAKSKQEIERHFSKVFMVDYQGQGLPLGDVETENPEARQIQVMVHRSVSLSHEDVESVQMPQEEDFEFYINKFTTETTDLVVAGKSNGDSDQVIVLSDVTEVQNVGGYPTVVAHIVSKLAPDKEGHSKPKSTTKNKKDFNCGSQANAHENSVKGDPQPNLVSDGNDAPVKETSLTESYLRKTALSAADVPSCSWENLSGNQRADSGYGEEETCQTVGSSDTKLSNVISGSDVDSTKRSNNGCFGNIFSRRVPVSLTNTESTIKNESSISQKKLFYHKAATWEKCNREHKKSLLNSSPLDPVNDLKKLALIMQKYSLSSVDLADMIGDDVRSCTSDVDQVKKGESLSPIFYTGEPIADGVTTDGSTKVDGQSSSGYEDQSDEDDDLSKNSSNTSSMVNSFHISLLTEETHL